MEGHEPMTTADNSNSRHRQSPTSGSAATTTSPVAHSAHHTHQPTSHHHHFTTLRRLVTIGVAIWMSYLFLGSNFSELFQYHPVTMIISFVGLLPEITALTNVIRRQRSVGDREACIARHMYLSLLMKFFSIIGFIAITINKNRKGKHHYTTWHGKIGLATVVILVLQVIVGLVYYFRLFGGGMQSAGKWRKVHKWLGISLLLAGSASMWLGMRTHFVERAVHSNLVNFLFGTITFVACITAYYKE